MGIGIGGELHLNRAILIYEGTGGIFATVHQVGPSRKGPPELLAGEPVTVGFVRALAEGLGNRLAPEILPANVLTRTPDLIAWWTPATTRPMFFREGSALGKVNGRTFPHPALVWKVDGANLSIRALVRSERPTAETLLCRAPYWNTNDAGLVCQGSMRRPEHTTAENLKAWEDGYFGSQFTHPYGASVLTTLKGGIEKMWPRLVGRETFPARYLVGPGQTLAQFVEVGRA